MGMLIDSKTSLDAMGGTRLFNVFHPLDPIAYRVEPLLVPELATKQEAEKVPTHSEAVDSWALQATQAMERSKEAWETHLERLEKSKEDLVQKVGKGTDNFVEQVSKKTERTDRILNRFWDECERRKLIPAIPEGPDAQSRDAELIVGDLDAFLADGCLDENGRGSSLEPLVGIVSKESCGSTRCSVSSSSSIGLPRQSIIKTGLQLQGRIDWVLQTDTSEASGIGTDAIMKLMRQRSDEPNDQSVNDDLAAEALRSHSNYLRDPDVARFIHASSQSLIAGPQNDELPSAGAIGLVGKALAKKRQETLTDLSQTWKDSGAQDRATKAGVAISEAASAFSTSARESFEASGIKDVVKGAGQAAVGVVGTARMLYGTARLLGAGATGVASTVSAVSQAAQASRTT